MRAFLPWTPVDKTHPSKIVLSGHNRGEFLGCCIPCDPVQ